MIELFVLKFKYWYKGFYLLEGFFVIINVNFDSFLKFFIFKDRKCLDEWFDCNSDLIEIVSSDIEYFL